MNWKSGYLQMFTDEQGSQMLLHGCCTADTPGFPCITGAYIFVFPAILLFPVPALGEESDEYSSSWKGGEYRRHVEQVLDAPRITYIA